MYINFVLSILFLEFISKGNLTTKNRLSSSGKATS